MLTPKNAPTQSAPTPHQSSSTTTHNQPASQPSVSNEAEDMNPLDDLPF